MLLLYILLLVVVVRQGPTLSVALAFSARKRFWDRNASQGTCLVLVPRHALQHAMRRTLEAWAVLLRGAAVVAPVPKCRCSPSRQPIRNGRRPATLVSLLLLLMQLLALLHQLRFNFKGWRCRLLDSCAHKSGNERAGIRPAHLPLRLIGRRGRLRNPSGHACKCCPTMNEELTAARP